MLYFLPLQILKKRVVVFVFCYCFEFVWRANQTRLFKAPIFKNILTCPNSVPRQNSLFFSWRNKANKLIKRVYFGLRVFLFLSKHFSCCYFLAPSVGAARHSPPFWKQNWKSPTIFLFQNRPRFHSFLPNFLCRNASWHSKLTFRQQNFKISIRFRGVNWLGKSGNFDAASF